MNPKFPRLLRFFSRISNVVLLGAFLTAMVVAFSTFYFVHLTLQRSVMASQQEMAKQIMRKIDFALYERYHDIQQIAQESLLKNFVASSTEKPGGDSVFLDSELAEIINQLALLTGPWDILYVVNRAGRIVLSTDEDELGKDIGKEPQSAMAYESALRGEVYVSDLVLSDDTEKKTILFAAPIWKKTEGKSTVAGVVIADYTWKITVSVLEETRQHAVLLDQFGRPIAVNSALTSSASSWFERIREKFGREASGPQKTTSWILADAPGASSEEYLVSMTPQRGYLSYRGHHWSLLLGISADEAFASAWRTAMVFVFFVVFLILCTSLVVYLSVVRMEQALQANVSQLAQSNKILNQEIENRKRLENAALQSEKMAAVGQLAAGVAHEINNPLGVILGFSQALVKRLTPGEPFEMPIKSIEREALRCKDLVQDLLVFSRKSKAEKEEIDLNQAVEGALSLVLAQAKVKDTTLVKELAADIPTLMANKSQIQQVVINLCNNAMDAMPKGGTITLRTKTVSVEGKEVVEIQVQDTGHGIPKEIQCRIFEPFFTTKGAGKGTGLGLSLVFEIIQKHDGNITLESEPGQGTLFRIWLPRAPKTSL